MWAALVAPEALFLVRWMVTFSLCPQIIFPLCLSLSEFPLCKDASSSSHVGLRPVLVTSSYLIYLSKGPVSKNVTLEGSEGLNFHIRMGSTVCRAQGGPQQPCRISELAEGQPFPQQCLLISGFSFNSWLQSCGGSLELSDEGSSQPSYLLVKPSFLFRTSKHWAGPPFSPARFPCLLVLHLPLLVLNCFGNLLTLLSASRAWLMFPPSPQSSLQTHLSCPHSLKLIIMGILCGPSR